MPRDGSIASDAANFLRRKRNGATIGEIFTALNAIRRFPVPRPSVRSALYQHLDGRGERLFVRIGRGRYALRK